MQRSACAKSLAESAREESSAGAGLARFSIARVEDYQSNLLSQRYLTREETETYVRNNVRSLVHDYTREGFFHRRRADHSDEVSWWHPPCSASFAIFPKSPSGDFMKDYRVFGA